MTDDTRSSGSDPIADFQRWLMRSSARSLSRELKGQARRTFGGGGSGRDVWETATAEPIPGEAPECAWCPVCRAARRFRLSGPGLASHVAGAGDALLTAAQDTLAAFEATLSARPPGAAREPQAGSPGHTGSSEGTGWPDEAPPGSAHATTETAAGAAPGPSAEAGQGPSAEAGQGQSAEAGQGQSAEAGQGQSAEAGQGPSAEAGDGQSAEAGQRQSAEAGQVRNAEAGDGQRAEAGEGQSAEPDGPDRRS